jgi:hypothetical protein
MAAVFGFAMLGAVWSFADFHPGGDLPFDEQAARTAERGMTMHKLYLWPVLALPRIFRDSHAMMLFAKIHWFILPLIYGGLLHLFIWASTVTWRYLFRRRPDAAEQSLTGWE